MTTDKAEGKGKEVIGSVKEKAGGVTGDQELQARGEGEKLEGKGQGLVGKVKDAAGDAKDKVKDAVKG